MAKELCSGLQEDAGSTVKMARWWLWMPLLLGAGLYCLGLKWTDLWTPDEPRYAEVAREMLQRDDYVQPYCNGEKYTEKPPLFFWMVAALAKLRGEVDQLAVRLPSAASAVGTLALLIWFCARFFGRREAFVAGLVLCTSPQFFWLARSGHIDMLLTFLITASLVSFYRFYCGGGWWYGAVFYGCLALATLAKGPVGMLLPILVAVCFAALSGDWRAVKRLRPALGLPAVAAVVMLWYIPAMGQASGYDPGSMVLRQIIGRMFHPTSHSVSIFYWPFYHATVLAYGMAPWSLLLPFAAAEAYRARRDKSQTPRLFLLCWSGAIFAFFTLIASKRELYILPMYPAAAALAGIWLTRSETRASFRMPRLATAAYGAALVCLGLSALTVLPGCLAKACPDLPTGVARTLLPLCAPAGAVAIAAAFFSRRRTHVIAACASASVVLFAVLIIGVLPWVNTWKSPQAICSVFASCREADSELGMYGRARTEYVFYAQCHIHPIAGVAELRRFFDTDRRMFCFIAEKHFGVTRAEADFPMHVLARRFVSSRTMLLVCNQPAAPLGETAAVAGKVGSWESN